MDAGPEVGLFTLGWGLTPLQEVGKGVMDSLVVDEDVHWTFRRGDEVH